MINVYIGYDEVEAATVWTLAHSIVSRSSQPVRITPICLNQMPLTRARHPKQSNEFAFSRWLVPYLSGYHGFSLFMDCDFLCLDDIAKLWYLRDDRYAVQVCKHPWGGEDGEKFLGQEQTQYNRKCWSSLIMFNNAKCSDLTPEYIDEADGLHLHQFRWLEDDQIGSLPLEWNWLVGVYPYSACVKMLHYTQGGPYFSEYANCDYNEHWWRENRAANHVVQRSELSKFSELAHSAVAPNKGSGDDTKGA